MKLNTTELQSFMTGNLLGDGYVHKDNFCFMTNQINKDLIEFKAKIFKRYLGFSTINIHKIPESIDKFGVHRRDSWRLYVGGNKYLQKQRELFYDDLQITTPQNIFKKITPLGLAIWYADDGTTIQVGYNPNTKSASRRRVQICTDDFKLEDVEFMATELSKRYGRIKIINRGKDKGYRLDFKMKSAQKFLLDIAPYFIKYFPSLLYKLDLGYRGESLENRRYVSEEYHKLYLKISSHKLFIDRLKEKGYNK